MLPFAANFSNNKKYKKQIGYADAEGKKKSRAIWWRVGALSTGTSGRGLVP